jgi:hypothetical protein
MLSIAWTRWLQLSSNRGPAARSRRLRGSRSPALLRRSFVPRLEALEDRLCLSWTNPVNLGPPINTEYDEGYPVSLTNNGLSLYFGSNRPGSYGQQDIWVSQRASIDDPWGAPQNLGPTINSTAPYLQHSPHITEDGHRMYFFSTRPGDYGAGDLWVSYRQDTHDDFAWGEPVNLGPNINTVGAVSACPSFFEDPRTGLATLYFVSDRLEDHHLHVFTSIHEPDGSFAPAIPVPELNSPRTEEHFAVRPDGLMGIVASNRLGGFGQFDLWITTRASTQDPWSTPENMGPTINTDVQDTMPSWSPDGRTFFFGSNRDGGYGGTDLYYTTWQSDTWTVTSAADNGPGSLREAIAAAFSGDRIAFDQSLQGQTIRLTSGQLAISKDLDIEGPGADQLTVSGNHASRVFSISGGVTVTIAGLTIADGLVVGADGGGGILNVGSTLTLGHDVVSNNEAIGGPGVQIRAGAIRNASGATLTVMDSLFTYNQARGASGSAAQGGAIYNESSALTVSHSTFLSNQALGGPGANANSGAIANAAFSTLTISNSTFIGNQAVGGDGGGSCSGGVTNNATGSTATISHSTFVGNQVIGGDGGGGGTVGFGRGGAIYNNTATLRIEDSTFTGNQAIGGRGGRGGSSSLNLVDQATGGGIFNADNAVLVLTGGAFTGNQALGGSNATGGTSSFGYVGAAIGGGLANGGVATVTDCTFENNEALGGTGNTGGSGFMFVGAAIGGAISTSAENTSATPGILTASNLTLRHNLAVGGAGNATGNVVGEAIGGGLTNSGAGVVTPSGGSTTTISNSTIMDNQAVGGHAAPGGNGRNGRGGGLANVFGATLIVSGSTLSGNLALGGAGRAGGSGFGGGLFNDGPSTHPSNPGVPTILTVLDSTITDNEAEGGAAGAGGTKAGLGAGGGIASAGILTVLGSGLSHNWALGRDGAGGPNGGDGLGGGLYIAGGTASVLDTAIHHNRAFGGDGDTGGNGLGGGVYVAAGTVVVSASDISDNQAVGGLGGDGGTDGLGVGGGAYNLGTFLFDALTVIRHNRASDSNDDCFGC